MCAAVQMPGRLARVLYPNLLRWVRSCALATRACLPVFAFVALPCTGAQTSVLADLLPWFARSLHLGGGSLPHFSSFLPLCRRLEVLGMCLSGMGHEAEQLICTHLW